MPMHQGGIRPNSRCVGLLPVLFESPVHAANGGTAAEMTKLAEIVLHFMTMQDLSINATGLG
jgi:hypothetical protein